MAFYKIIASQIGTDAGPFKITTNAGVVIATGVTRLQLLAGYTFDVPVGVSTVTVENETGSACVTNETFVISVAGFWEMQKSGVEAVSDHYGVLVAPYVVPVESFAADGVIGINAAIVSGTGTWTIKGGPEAILGTTYNGGGTLITTKSNTNTLTTVEALATLQLGLDINAFTGLTGGTLTVNAGGFANAVGANEPAGRNVFTTLVNNGNVNITGPDRCGEGYFTATTVNNLSVITIDNASFKPSAYGTGVGTILVNDGATLEAAATGIPITQTIQLNGCGKCNLNGFDDGALLYGSAVQTIAAPIQVLTDSCMKTTSGGLATFTGQITGTSKLSVGNKADSTSVSGTTTFANAVGTFNGTLEVKNTSLYNNSTNVLDKADIVLVENGKIQQDGGVFNIGSLASTSTTATILFNSSVTLNIKENGDTTYAGLLQNSTPGTPWVLNLSGPDTNQIKFTGAGGVVQLNSLNGAKIIVQGGTFEFWQSTTGGTISAGTSKATIIKTLYLRADAFLDVYAASSGSGKITATAVAYLLAGWKVNIKDNLAAGVYDILVSPNPTSNALPTVAANASGLTASFAWVGTTLKMTLV